MAPPSDSRQQARRPRQFSIQLILVVTVFVATMLMAIRNLTGETILVVGIVAAGLAWGNLLLLLGAFVGALLAYGSTAGPAAETSYLMISAMGLLLGLLTGWNRHRDEVREVLQRERPPT